MDLPKLSRGTEDQMSASDRRVAAKRGLIRRAFSAVPTAVGLPNSMTCQKVPNSAKIYRTKHWKRRFSLKQSDKGSH